MSFILTFTNTTLITLKGWKFKIQRSYKIVEDSKLGRGQRHEYTPAFGRRTAHSISDTVTGSCSHTVADQRPLYSKLAMACPGICQDKDSQEVQEQLEILYIKETNLEEKHIHQEPDCCSWHNSFLSVLEYMFKPNLL